MTVLELWFLSWNLRRENVIWHCPVGSLCLWGSFRASDGVCRHTKLYQGRERHFFLGPKEELTKTKQVQYLHEACIIRQGSFWILPTSGSGCDVIKQSRVRGGNVVLNPRLLESLGDGRQGPQSIYKHLAVVSAFQMTHFPRRGRASQAACQCLDEQRLSWYLILSFIWFLVSLKHYAFKATVNFYKN